MEKQTVVIYHGGCYDGFGAAWVAWHAYRHRKRFPNLTLIPAYFNQPLEQLPEGADVYIIDFSYPRDVLLRMKEQHPNLVVLDHHKTAQADLETLEFCIFDMNRSGAMLAWNYWFPDEEPPDLIKYVQDRDLWRFDLPQSRAYHAGLSTYPREFPIWDQIVDNEPQTTRDIAGNGELILNYQYRLLDDMCDQTTWRNIAGYTVPVVNATVLFSDIGNELARRHPEAPFSAYYYDRADGNRHWGLRSIGSFDVSVIAKMFEGGGHRNASGFVGSQLSMFPIAKQGDDT